MDVVFQILTVKTLLYLYYIINTNKKKTDVLNKYNTIYVFLGNLIIKYQCSITILIILNRFSTGIHFNDISL